MKVKFNAPRKIDGIDYAPGLHEMPDTLRGHWYLLACIQNNSCTIIEDVPVEEVEISEKSIEELVQQENGGKTYHQHQEEYRSKDEVKADHKDAPHKKKAVKGHGKHK